MDGASDDALPRFDNLLGQQPAFSGRTVDRFEETWTPQPRQRLAGNTNFEITPVARPGSPLPPAPDAMSWVSRWLDTWRAAEAKNAPKAAARRAIGGAGEIDPATGRQIPPEEELNPDDVNSFAQIGGAGGGGGGAGAGQVPPASTTSALDGARK